MTKHKPLENIGADEEVSIRYGRRHEDGVEWGEWHKARLLVSHDLRGGTYVSPLTPEGRSLSLTFKDVGEELESVNDPTIVLGVGGIHSFTLLRQAFEEGRDVVSFLREHDVDREDLPPLGKAIYDALTAHKGAVPKEFVQRMFDTAEAERLV